MEPNTLSLLDTLITSMITIRFVTPDIVVFTTPDATASWQLKTPSSNTSIDAAIAASGLMGADCLWRLRRNTERLATPGGLEPPTCRLEGGCSIQLSYGAVDQPC